MPLELIGAGYGRTGTLSVYTALNQLGFPCYHMFEVMKARHVPFWHKVANMPPGTPHAWETVFANYKAAVDFPASCVWRELLDAYPNARVLLTFHPKGPGAWYDSAIETIYQASGSWHARVLWLLVPASRKFGDMLDKLIWQRTLKGTMPNRSKALAQYEAHMAEVKASVPPERLLVYSVDQGWAPLCAFLGVPVPDTPFPNVNDRASMKAMQRRMKYAAYALISGVVIIVGAAIYAAARFLG